VRIDTRLGQGTTVAVYLPRAASSVADGSGDAAAGPHRDRRPAAILVVDDDPDVREFAVAALGNLGYAVTAAESGRAALDLLDGRAPVDLMLIDHAMPELTGVDTVRLARAKRPDMRILLMTGYAETAALVAEAGRDGILKKPFTLAELAAAIEATLKADAAHATGKVVPIRLPASSR
jgi:CheY-like chemotaxis protein